MKCDYCGSLSHEQPECPMLVSQSERAMSKTTGPLPVVAAVTGGCMAVPVAEILRDELQEEIDTEETQAAWQRDWYDRPDLAAKHDAQALKLRRQMEEWNLRQPPYNIGHEPRPGGSA